MWKTTKTLSDVYYMHIPTQTSLLDIFGNTCERCQGSAVVRRIASRRVAVVFPLTSPSTCLLHYLAPTHPAPYTSNEMTSRNVALEVLAQYFWRIKCGISNNAALWWKKLAARWGDRSRNVENLFHAADMLENLVFWWGDDGAESTEIFAYLSPCSTNSVLDVAARQKKPRKCSNAGRVRRIRCFLRIWNRNMIRTSRNGILAAAAGAMTIQIISGAHRVHSFNARDYSLALCRRSESRGKSICRL